jgi:hypothetical protein
MMSSSWGGLTLGNTDAEVVVFKRICRPSQELRA